MSNGQQAYKNIMALKAAVRATGVTDVMPVISRGEIDEADGLVRFRVADCDVPRVGNMVLEVRA